MVAISRSAWLRVVLVGMALLLCGAGKVRALSLGDWTGSEPLPGGVRLLAAGGALELRVYRDDILRLDLIPAGAAPPDSTPCLTRAPAGGAPLEVVETEDEIHLPGVDPPLRFQKRPLRLRAALPGGGELREPAGGWLWQGENRELRLEIQPDWHLLGTGERSLGADLAGRSFSLVNTQSGGYSGPLETMNINVPVVLCSAGFGLLVNTAQGGWLDLGASDPGLLSWTLPGGGLSLFLLRSGELGELVEAHTWLTGRPGLPPRWALGYLQSKYGYRNEAQARAVVADFRARGLPLDALILDLYWFDEMGDLAWDPTTWPDPAGLIEDLLAQGVHTVLITEPYLTATSTWFEPLVQQFPHYLAHHSDGQPWRLPNWWSCGCDAVLFDFTHPDACAWWWERHLPLFDAPLGGLWTDLGEPERHPEGMRHHGGTAAEVHNLYNLLWTRTLAEGFRSLRPDQRLFQLSRSGTAGSQRYGVFTWSGDVARSWGGLRVQGPLLLHMGLSGFPYHGSDLGGFCCGPADGELYLRWLQAGALSPAMRAHGVDDIPTEPWGFGSGIEEAAAEMLRLRQSRLPLLYSLAWDAHESGLPLARPLALADPAFAQLWDVDDAWLLGDQLLVAPVTQSGAVSRMVWLPDGEWIDVATGQRYAGRQPVWLPAPLERLPQLVRGGGILPRQPRMDWAGQRPLDTLGVDLWPRPGAAGSFRLYEDDGLSLAHEQGVNARTALELDWSDNGDGTADIIFRALPTGGWPGMPQERIWQPVFRGLPGPPSHVLVDGNLAALAASPGELAGMAAGWWLDLDDGALKVQAAGPFMQSREVVVAGVPLETGLAPTPRPEAWRLEPVWPNPANGILRVEFTLPAAESVELDVVDLAGRRVARLASGPFPAGTHRVALEADRLSSGLYLVTLSGRGWRETRKATVLR